MRRASGLQRTPRTTRPSRNAPDRRTDLTAYNFIDLKFHLTEWPAARQRTGSHVVRSLLKDASFVRQDEREDDKEERLRCLEDICTEINAGHRRLTIMATAKTLPPIDPWRRFQIRRGREPRPFALFPQEFEITDAYITNAPTVSLNRHFYW